MLGKVLSFVPSEILIIFFKDFKNLLLGRGEGREKEGEKHQCARGKSTGCLSHTLNWGPGPQHRNVP